MFCQLQSRCSCRIESDRRFLRVDLLTKATTPIGLEADLTTREQALST